MTGSTTLLRAPLWDVVGEHRHLLYGVTQGTFLPAGGDRWLFGAVDEDDRRPLAEVVREAAGVDELPIHVERSRAFTAATQVADTFRGGPVLLAGDAAHRVTPRGGTGLNLALHDGFDLGWKLAWLHRGWAGDELLDSYEAERRPVVEHAAARSAHPGGSIREPIDGVGADLGGRIPHVWSGGRSTLDLLGTGLTFLTGPDGDGPVLAPDGVPVDVHRLDPVAAWAVGATGRSGVLVRPDGRRCGVPVPDADRSPAPALA